jgi:hypothetical protein
MIEWIKISEFTAGETEENIKLWQKEGSKTEEP